MVILNQIINQTHLPDIYRSYLIYFQVCNKLKILRNNNVQYFPLQDLHMFFPNTYQY